MRNTKQNSLILDIVYKAHNHPTAYDVYLECIKVIPNISLTTVYRNLNKLVSKRKIQRFELDDNIFRYDKNTCQSIRSFHLLLHHISFQLFLEYCHHVIL